jgi:hypothetical protein
MADDETPQRIPEVRTGRARELSRGSVKRPAPPDTGRRHHIGAAPAELVMLGVLGADGADGVTRTTRTAPIQLADLNDSQLRTLATRIESEMARAADALDFELAAHLREEAAAVHRELDRRADR